MEHSSQYPQLPTSYASPDTGSPHARGDAPPSIATDFATESMDATLEATIWNAFPSSVRAVHPPSSVDSDGWPIHSQFHPQATGSPTVLTEYSHLSYSTPRMTFMDPSQGMIDQHLFTPMATTLPNTGFTGFHAPGNDPSSASWYSLPLMDSAQRDASHLPATTPSSPVQSAYPTTHSSHGFDDHYLDSPATSFYPRRRSTSDPANYHQLQPLLSSYPSPAEFAAQPSPLYATRRRNVAVPYPGTPQLSEDRSQWRCPHCNYAPNRRRNQDLRRHMETHTRPDVPLWSCCGVPLSQARQYGVPDDVIAASFAGASSTHYPSQDPRIGGCNQGFSRKDALQRHLREKKGRCFGDALAPWHPGNRRREETL
ncbi:hypothetical protein C8Q76DRAFT_661283 [Earliella scabrosa]|nr:hypothetical protein C8Q76DRAFT_661283 [Earliella scabrosa]